MHGSLHERLRQSESALRAALAADDVTAFAQALHIYDGALCALRDAVQCVHQGVVPQARARVRSDATKHLLHAWHAGQRLQASPGSIAYDPLLRQILWESVVEAQVAACYLLAFEEMRRSESRGLTEAVS